MDDSTEHGTYDKACTATLAKLLQPSMLGTPIQSIQCPTAGTGVQMPRERRNIMERMHKRQLRRACQAENTIRMVSTSNAREVQRTKSQHVQKHYLHSAYRWKARKPSVPRREYGQNQRANRKGTGVVRLQTEYLGAMFFTRMRKAPQT